MLDTLICIKKPHPQATGVIDFWRSLRARLVLLFLPTSAPLLAITLYTASETRNGEVESSRASNPRRAPGRCRWS